MNRLTGAEESDSAGSARTVVFGAARDRSTMREIAGDQYNVYVHENAPPPAVACTLPPDPAVFTGRSADVAKIIGAAVMGDVSGQVPLIFAIDGMPGVGKTSLALHVAYRLADRFPDRQLFLDLHAHSPGQRPTAPADALATLLMATGVDARNVPAELDERASMWRDRMAGQRALLILDNAVDSEQITPLLPGSAASLVLITSRRFLGDIPRAVTNIPLESLSPEDSLRMFLRLAPKAEEEPGKAADLVALCGYLPLAIVIVARLCALHPSWGMDYLINETTGQLLTASAEQRTVAATFSLSYQHMGTPQQRFFRLVSWYPGNDLDVYAAAALAAVTTAEADARLTALGSERLITEHGFRRFRMHDLVRQHGRDLSAAEDVDDGPQAVARLLSYYQQAADAADARLARHQWPFTRELADEERRILPALPEATAARRWLDAEYENLLAGIDWAAQRSLEARVIGIAAAIAAFLRATGRWPLAVVLHSAAVSGALRIGDRPGEAGARTDLGSVSCLVGDNAKAVAELEQARAIYRSLGSELGEANSLTYLGITRYLNGEIADAVTALEEALAIYRVLGDRLGEANALNHLGVCRYLVGRNPEAVDVLTQAREIYQELGHEGGEANACSMLGAVRQIQGEYQEAATVLQQALAAYRRTGERLGEAQALSSLGTLDFLTEEYANAAAYLKQARDIYVELGDLIGEANALNYLGTVLSKDGDGPAAARLHEQALHAYRRFGDRLGEANALNALGALQLQGGDLAAAEPLLEQAAGGYHDLGEPVGESEVLNLLGTLYLIRGAAERAEELHRSALALATDCGYQREAAHALEGIGKSSLAAGRSEDAARAFEEAVQIYQVVAPGEATRLAAEIGVTGT
jgi:tetratricopeptide (TPR) repeat protein